jgi:hypothetical protein
VLEVLKADCHHHPIGGDDLIVLRDGSRAGTSRAPEAGHPQPRNYIVPEMLKTYSRDAEAGAEIDWEQYRCSAQASLASLVLCFTSVALPKKALVVQKNSSRVQKIQSLDPKIASCAPNMQIVVQKNASAPRLIHGNVVGPMHRWDENCNAKATSSQSGHEHIGVPGKRRHSSVRFTSGCWAAGPGLGLRLSSRLGTTPPAHCLSKASGESRRGLTLLQERAAWGGGSGVTPRNVAVFQNFEEAGWLAVVQHKLKLSVNAAVVMAITSTNGRR